MALKIQKKKPADAGIAETKAPASEAQATVTKDVTDNSTKTLVSSETKAETVDTSGVAPAKNTQQEPWCQVGFDASYTHNLGNYQSCKVGVSLTIPCPHGEIDAVFDFSKKWVQDRLQKEIDDLTGE